MSQNPKKFDVNQLQYYFDSKVKDVKDSSGLCAKSRKVLALRDRLMTLPDSEFDIAIQTLNGLLDKKSQQQQSDEDKTESDEAYNLYERSQGTEARNPGKVNPI